MPFGYSNEFIPLPIQTEVSANEEDSKRLFGSQLAKGYESPFAAALVVFPNDARKALQISVDWITDPIVLASKDTYLKTTEKAPTILDKETFAAKILKLAEEKNVDGTRYLIEAKERVSLYNLYAKVAGYIDQINVDASTKTINNNSMTVRFVSAKKEKAVVIDSNATEISNEENRPKPTLKLVKAIGA